MNYINYILVFTSLFSIHNAQSQSIEYPEPYIKSNIGKLLHNNYSTQYRNETKELIDSIVTYMLVDPELGFADTSFWANMTWQELAYDDQGFITEDSVTTFLYSYDTGVKDLVSKTKWQVNINGQIENEYTLRANWGTFDTLHFKYYYTEFNEVDSILLFVQFENNQYLVRKDYYSYNNSDRLDNIERYVLDNTGKWFQGAKWELSYDNDQIKNSNATHLIEYADNNTIINEQIDSMYYNENGQLKNTRNYYLESGKFNFGSGEQYHYSNSYQEYPDSLATFYVENGEEFNDSVLRLYKRNIEVSTTQPEKNTINCLLPNPYQTGDLIQLKWIENTNTKSIINVYNILGQIIYSTPFKSELQLPDLGTSGIYLFNIYSQDQRLIHSSKFMFIN